MCFKCFLKQIRQFPYCLRVTEFRIKLTTLLENIKAGHFAVSWITENHCTSVNFPLVLPRVGRMAARSPPRIRCSTCPQTNTKEGERTMEPGAQKRETERKKKRCADAHPLRVYVHIRPRYAHACVYSENVPRENSTGRLVHLHARLFPIPLGYFLLLDSIYDVVVQ